AAGGIEPVTDHEREPDVDNPHGYLEFERVKQIKTDQSWLPDSMGKSVKMIHALLEPLPDNHQYRVVFMRRNLDEILASQSKMLERQGKSGANLPPAVLKKVFQDQLDKALAMLASRPNFEVHEVWYHEVVKDPQTHAESIDTFLGGGLDIEAMVGAVDPKLYRNKSS
ncbi:MAG: sulfotransferase, partial [Phycisphaerales bacterium]|nr:sulfotransferase [Phycisphaerales bacterium]